MDLESQPTIQAPCLHGQEVRAWRSMGTYELELQCEMPEVYLTYNPGCPAPCSLVQLHTAAHESGSNALVREYGILTKGLLDCIGGVLTMAHMDLQARAADSARLLLHRLEEVRQASAKVGPHLPGKPVGRNIS